MEKRCCRTCKYCKYYDSDELYAATHDEEDKSFYYCKRFNMIVDGENQCYDYEKNAVDCYITTACVEYFNMTDDCDILQTIRKFRDTYLLKNPKKSYIVDEYYKNAPNIVKKINDSKNKDEIYKSIFNNMIKPCYDAILKGENFTAEGIYLSNYLQLKKDFS